MTQHGIFVDKIDTPDSLNYNDEIIMYLSIPETSYAYKNSPNVDMSTPEKYIKQLKKTLVEGLFNGYNIRIKYGDNWTKEDGKIAFEYNKMLIVSSNEFPKLPPHKQSINFKEDNYHAGLCK